MYKIGEFSKITFMTVKTLRYYDEIGLIIPSDIDENTGYRFYDEENYKTAMYVKALKSYDFTVKEMLDVVPRIKEPNDLTDFLLEKSRQIDDRIASLKKVKKSIESKVESLKEVNEMKDDIKIEIVEIEEVLVASIRYKGKYQDVGTYLGKIFKEVGMNGTSAPFSMYYDEDYTEENADIEICVPVKKQVNKGEVRSRVLPKQKCVAITHIGPYEELCHSYKAVTDYVNDNKLETILPSREIYLKGPGMIFKGNPEKYETRILIPIK